jgi:NTP pyrophosphatase (non-canonical NTP hydrolase)
MAQAHQDQSLRQFQTRINDIYGITDDRLYSIFDLLTQMQRFTMRVLKGIRKGDIEKLRTNLLISFAWVMPIANRMHVDVEDEIWKRFLAVCSYCGCTPCTCEKTNPEKRVKTKLDSIHRPTSIQGFQEMFRAIYPPESRTLSDAGVHLAEETGEVSEAIHNFLGQHVQKQFNEIGLEIADYISCLFGVANSAKLDIAPALKEMFEHGCHVCHKTPCVCTFSEVVEFKS